MSRIPASKRERLLVASAVARLRTGILATVLGLVGGFGLAIATAWLTLLGGNPVGPHLGLLVIFFPGYSVSWPGVAVGFVYGLLSGALAGGVIGWIYNRVVEWRDRER